MNELAINRGRPSIDSILCLTAFRPFSRVANTAQGNIDTIIMREGQVGISLEIRWPPSDPKGPLKIEAEQLTLPRAAEEQELSNKHMGKPNPASNVQLCMQLSNL